ncbi:hypothetical protein DFJ74DRAFT_690305 [Hyaloraphidium curvatum]|nr:hypothetical protein DFJ74DRAFT_690305 [Hyaloraphidium curvatum]
MASGGGSESDGTRAARQWLPVCALSDLEPHGRTVLRVQRRGKGKEPETVFERIFITKGIDAVSKQWDGAVYAITAICPHAGALLSNGRVMDVTDLEDLVKDPERKSTWGKLSGTGREFTVVCPAHGLDFNLCTGESLSNPSLPPAKTWKARIAQTPTVSQGAAAGLRYENVPSVEIFIETDWTPTDMVLASSL